MELLQSAIEICTVLPFLCTLGAGLYLAYKSRLVQLRALGMMARLLRASAPEAGEHQIGARAALLTAMSTTIGVGNIVGPIVAVGMGGPGALVCYVLATLLGGAIMYSEVWLGARHRKVAADGRVAGGPMTYPGRIHPRWATLYALACALLLLGWSATNANTMALTLAQYDVPRAVTGVVMAACVWVIVTGGIVRVAKINDLLVPAMCLLYCAGTGWIIFGAHGNAVPAALRLVFGSFWHPGAVGYGLGVSTTMQVLRHGFARALQANEAGVGTATIPHAMAAGDGTRQAVLAMVSVYFNGLLCFLTGLTVVVAGPYPPGTVFDVTLLSRIFADEFSVWGGAVLNVSIRMFTFGTIVGNCFNGGHCTESWAGSRRYALYYAASAAAVVAGALFELRDVFACIDYLIVPTLLCNTFALVWFAHRGEIDFRLPAGGQCALSPFSMHTRALISLQRWRAGRASRRLI